MSESKTDFRIRTSIPVVRMLDEKQTKSFYIDYLGFEIDWEHRFRDDPSSPLYAQIRHGDAILHLNGHAEEDSPKCEVRFPVENLVAFCEYLRDKTNGTDKPEIVDPRYEGRPTDLNIIDPSGNTLVFWAPSSDVEG